MVTKGLARVVENETGTAVGGSRLAGHARELHGVHTDGAFLFAQMTLRDAEKAIWPRINADKTKANLLFSRGWALGGSWGSWGRKVGFLGPLLGFCRRFFGYSGVLVSGSVL